MKKNNSKFQSVVQGKVRWLFALFALLTFGGGQMWAEEGVPKQISKDTAYIITPTISTKDTIYLKYEQSQTATKSSWDIYGGIFQSILLLVLGAGISWLTTTLDNRKERKLKKQEKIADKAIEIEERIYSLLMDIRNTQDNKERKRLLRLFVPQLQKAELTMRTPLYQAAHNLYSYYLDVANDANQVQHTEVEEMLLETYKAYFNQRV